MSDEDSLARRAFFHAEALLHDLSWSDTRLAPPLDLDLVAAPLRSGEGDDSPPRRVPRAVEEAPACPVLSKGPTLTEALAGLREGRLTTRELVEDALLVAGDSTDYGAVVALDEEAVRAEADRLDAARRAGRARGALCGIPVTVKDVIDAAGYPTRAGSLAYHDAAPADAAGVARLRDAGALVLAKVATHEFALGVTTPQCRNPHDPTRIAGGSSGGSAIAVATGVGLASLGTDTRASLRVPAHCCGVVGFKPTFGRFSTRGIVPLSWTIDVIGPIARTVEDAATVLNVLGTAPFLDAGGRDGPGHLVVGVVPSVFEDAEEDVAHCCEAALARLATLGCRLVELDAPGLAELEEANALGLLISRSEAAAFHRSRGTDLSLCIDEVRDQLVAGLSISAADYLDAQRQRRALAERTVAAFSLCDVVVSPTAPLVAPPYGDYERYLLRLSRNPILWSLVGAPAVSMPCGASRSGLPVGLQIAAAPGREQTLVDIGVALERDLGTAS
jgi:aspartyl-tRNA(Asn)/glutamyl-tRNA(Gln) amidotransferase subunit A